MGFCFEISKNFGLIYILIENITVTRFVALTGQFNKCIEPGIGNPGSVGCMVDGIKHNIRSITKPGLSEKGTMMQ